MHDHLLTSPQRWLCTIRRLLTRLEYLTRAGEISPTLEALLLLAVISIGWASYTHVPEGVVHDVATIVEAEVEPRSQGSNEAVAQLETAQAMQAHLSAEGSPADQTSQLLSLQQTANSMLATRDVRAVAGRGGDDGWITPAGRQLTQIQVPSGAGRDVLYRASGFVPRITVPLTVRNGTAGEVVADLLVCHGDATFTGGEGPGVAGRITVCGLNGSQEICLPSLFQPASRASTLVSPSVNSVGSAPPERGGTNPVQGDHTTYSAFNSLDVQPATVAMQIDKSELFPPIRGQLMLSASLLVLLTGGGLLLTRSEMKLLRAELASARSMADADIASRTSSDAKIELTRRRLQHVADLAPFLIAFLDPNFIFRFANRAHVLWFQRPLDEIIGKPLNTLVEDLTATEYLEAMAAALETGLPQTVLHERSWVGRSKFVELTFEAQLDGKGALEGYCLTARDATEAALREQKLLLAARRDPLTGLCNRTSFTERLEQALGNVDSEASVLAIAALDIDDFQQVNDRFGHQVGDQILQELGRRIKAALRPADTVARLAADEIAVIMRFKAAGDVNVVGTRLLETIRKPFLIDQRCIQVTASIGFAIAIPGDTVDSLPRRAGMALRQIQGAGRDGMLQADIPKAPEPTMHDLTCQ